MDKYLSLIIIQNYSMKQRFLRMILKNLISMKSPSLTKGKRNPANEKLIYLIFQQGYSIILFLRKSLMRNSLKVTMNFLQKYTSDFSLFQRHSQLMSIMFTHTNPKEQMAQLLRLIDLLMYLETLQLHHLLLLQFLLLNTAIMYHLIGRQDPLMIMVLTQLLTRSPTG